MVSVGFGVPRDVGPDLIHLAASAGLTVATASSV
jgi:hypothetical protein